MVDKSRKLAPESYVREFEATFERKCGKKHVCWIFCGVVGTRKCLLVPAISSREDLEVPSSNRIEKWRGSLNTLPAADPPAYFCVPLLTVTRGWECGHF